MNTLLLMMGGSGTRLGADIPKQYILVDGKPVFYYIIREYLKCSEIDSVVLVTHKNWTDYVEEQIKSLNPIVPYSIVTGGNTRSESVKNGLNEAMKTGNRDDVVLIHDATHPYVDSQNISPIINAVRQYGGATLGGCQYDTVYQTTPDGFIEKVIPRQLVVSGASPEAFRLGKLQDIYAKASSDELDKMTSAGAIALAHGIPMKVLPANYLNLKITYPDDMELFKRLVDNYFFTEGKTE